MPGVGAWGGCEITASTTSQRASAPRHGARAQRPALKAGLCLIEGICFLLDYTWLLPAWLRGPVQCDRSQQKTGRRREIQGGILGSEKP